EDGGLVRPDDQREGTLITALRLSKDAEVGLGQRQSSRSITARIAHLSSDFPLICKGWAKPSRSSAVGTRSESSPSCRNSSPSFVRMRGTGFVVCAVCGLV